MLMYLAWEWDTGLFASAMHPKLSTYITIAWVRGKLSSIKRVQSHIASLIVFIDVMYLVSTEEVTTIVCFLIEPGNWATYNIEYKTTSWPMIAYVLNPVGVGLVY